MSKVAIRKALDGEITKWRNGQHPDVDIAYEGIAYTPTKNMYVRPVLYPAGVSNPSIGNEHYREYGTYVVRVNTPILNTGMKSSDTLSDSVTNWFKRGMGIEKDGLTIYIQNTPYAHFNNINDKWNEVYIEIPYYCDTIK